MCPTQPNTGTMSTKTQCQDRLPPITTNPHLLFGAPIFHTHRPSGSRSIPSHHNMSGTPGNDVLQPTVFQRGGKCKRLIMTITNIRMAELHLHALMLPHGSSKNPATYLTNPKIQPASIIHVLPPCAMIPLYLKAAVFWLAQNLPPMLSVYPAP